MCSVGATAGTGRIVWNRGDWNTEQIQWLRFQEALKLMGKDGRPAVIVFSADWCPHCKRYSRVFRDPEVVELSRKFIMVLVDVDRDWEINQALGRYGTYVPRTLFVGRDGNVEWARQGWKPNYPHLLDQSTSGELKQLMRDTLAGVKALNLN
jgi:thiol-disulfide isomerase/thioredoxin